MKRLTKRNEIDTAYYYPNCFEKCNGIGCSSKCDKCNFTYEICEKLGKYEDAEEQGLLLKSPYKVSISNIKRYMKYAKNKQHFNDNKHSSKEWIKFYIKIFFTIITIILCFLLKKNKSKNE